MRESKVSPSMMCADFGNLESCLNEFQRLGIDYLHIDIMDGSFVPNFTLGPDYINALRKYTNIPMDVHLMINNPEARINCFKFQPGDIVSVHYESTKHLQRALQFIKETGAKAAVALNPATPINALDYVLDDIDMVLVMTVNPGFAGQKLIPQTLDKIRDVRKYLDDKGYQDIMIEVDGNVSYENAKKMRACGAEIFVAGTSSMFKKEITLEEGYNKLKESIK